MFTFYLFSIESTNLIVNLQYLKKFKDIWKYPFMLIIDFISNF